MLIVYKTDSLTRSLQNRSTLQVRVVLDRPTAVCSYSSYVFISDRHRVRWPQGSVLGPILFLLYIADLQLLIEDRGLCPNHSADDTQIYGFRSPTLSSCTELQSCISECTDVVSGWMRSHRLQLNTAKTEVIWLTTGRRMHQLPQQPLRLGSDLITPVFVVRDLGINIDADASMRCTSCAPRLPVLRYPVAYYVSFGASAAWYLGLSSSPWCRVCCYRSWIIAPQ